ncbi:biopolymer transporter ExbD [Kamptonema sp. UHCC 0994]|uniref:ExbD/TolR family protein n=1 Tax=Kamptonema sp. UHCC 0994 TaxID=3031329 RepID=UPI0023BA2584|nr:biopolymer transporter ExbD [Kamptonema sp. UHCC 0994]MDF0554287.1 biopolymer transporter ExbD [Kamptonema sp. UHCC 0994]
MKIHLDTPAEETRIELVPLIDVIFCILTFFLLAALQLTRQQAINVDLPKARTGQSQMRDMMIVSIDDFGQTYIDQIPMNENQLDRVLQDYRKQNPNGLMVLYAPKDAKYARVVEVLDRLREVGGDRVALATLPSSSSSPSPSPSFPFNPNQQYQLPSTNPGQQPLQNQFQSAPVTPNQQPSGINLNPSAPGASPVPTVPTPGTTVPQQSPPSKSQ